MILFYSMLNLVMVRKMYLEMPHYCPVQDGEICQKSLKKVINFETKYPNFAQALNDFLKMEPQNITYPWTGYGIYPVDGILWGTSASQAILYLIGKIHANPTDKKMVFTVNEQIKKLIQWEFNLQLTGEMYTALENELIRVRYLTRLMEYREWSKTEILQLIGKTPLADYMRYINDLYCYFIISGETIHDTPLALRFTKDVFSTKKVLRKITDCLKTRSFLYTHTYYKLNFKLYIEKLVSGYKWVSAGKAIPFKKFLDDREDSFDMPAPYLNKVALINQIATEEVICLFQVTYLEYL